jgi:putative hydrolase
MIDLHTHSLLSDGELLPSELIRRAEVIGYEGIGITDHADRSNLDWIIPRIVSVCAELNRCWKIRAVPGIELTHVPPETILVLCQEARALGAKLVVVHGETIAEPVCPGTNRMAIEAKVDILAHPGFISDEEVQMAKGNGVFLEITARHGHSFTNGHVAKLAQKHNAFLVLNTDTHSPENLITRENALKVALGAGLSAEDFQRMQENSRQIFARLRK